MLRHELYAQYKTAPTEEQREQARQEYHIKAVLGFHLPGVMNHQQADAIPVTEGFQPGHDLIVAGVAVSVTADLPHLLQGVDDDEPYIRVLPDEAF